jgi:secreted trypsin-like serine protease
MKKLPANLFMYSLIVFSLIAICSYSVLAQGKSIEQDDALKGSKPYEKTVDDYLKKKQPKIVGGEPAPVGAYPWQVSLGVSWIADPYSAHFCGGSVLSERWIITAAHCAIRLTPAKVIITAGTNRLVASATRRNVKLIIVHKNYNDADPPDNDIALMELQDPLPTSLFITPIPLLTSAAESSVLFENALLAVTGWGATQEGGLPVRDLRFIADLPFVTTTTCNRPEAYDGVITDNMICAGKRAGGGKDSCQGDSGGPLAAQTKTTPQLAGIVSWGEGCGRAEKVGVYTRVSKYVDWVNSCLANSATCNQ